VNPEDPWTATAWLHRLQGWQRTPEKPAILRLPPGIDNNGLALGDDVVVPPPHVRLDRLPDRRHVLEAVVILLGLLSHCHRDRPGPRGSRKSVRGVPAGGYSGEEG